MTPWIMGGELNWARDGADWPNRAHSRFVEAGGLRWHVQVIGEADQPTLLLLHGTGASSHSFRHLVPRLRSQWRLVIPDLPGHAFSGALPPHRRSLPGMACATDDLLRALAIQPQAMAGHSAGAAVMLRMALDRHRDTPHLVGLNAALLPFDGMPGLLFAPIARLLALNPFVPWLASWRAREPNAVRRLIASTGSRLEEADVTYYARLIRSPAHVAGALTMMATWDLQGLVAELPRLHRPLHLIVGDRDGTVPSRQATQVAARAPNVRVHHLAGLGHLAHEEAPDVVAGLLLDLLARPG